MTTQLQSMAALVDPLGEEMIETRRRLHRLPELGFQGLDLTRLGGLLPAVRSPRLEDGGPVLEELLLPEVKEGRLDLVLLADLGDLHLLDQVLTKDGQLLGPGEMASVV